MDNMELLNELRLLNVILQSGTVNSWGNKILKNHKELYDAVYSFTKGFNKQSLSERIYCVRRNIRQQKKCLECNNPIVNFNVTIGYGDFCCKNCSNINQRTKKRIEESNFEKYGGHPKTTKAVQEKFKKTNMELYGVEYPIQREDFKEKVRKTNNSKYGADYYHQSDEGKCVVIETNLEKYGVEYPIQSKSFQEKIQKIIMKKYDVTSTAKLQSVKEKTRQTCLSKYNIAYSSQRNYKEGVLDKLNDKSFMAEEYKIKTLREIAHELFIDKKTVANYLKKHSIVMKEYSVSLGETEVGTYIKSIGVSIITNTFSIITPYELDIYIPEYKLAIEYCGLYWHSEAVGKGKEYHKMKYDMCGELGIQLLTIFEDEWFNRREQVKSKIKSLLHKDDSLVVYARKTQIVNVSKISKKIFYDQTHIQADGPSSIDIGLVYDNELVACMSFIKSTDEFTLNRYATSCHVPGGFSKLLKYFINEYSPKSIISFADLRWSTGNLYLKTGWEIDKILPPDYSYSPDAKHRFHKFNYRRKYLPNLLKNFDPELSERENCDNNGILRIWDCGKIRFKYIP